jgi:predicted AAA+ superfamily ATPase
MNTPKYIQRHIKRNLDAYLDQFPVVMLVGARQVGKTTFLDHELKGWTRVDLEDIATAELVISDPALFLKDHPDRIWFDEAHRVPSLFHALRVNVDKDRRPGRFVLSGSASGLLIKNVSESLAGRAGLLNLYPLSASEILCRKPSIFLEYILSFPEPPSLFSILQEGQPLIERELLWLWHTGGFPEPSLHLNNIQKKHWFDSYIRLVSERDLMSVKRLFTPLLIGRLLRMLSARHGQVINISSLASDFGFSHKTITNFLDIIEGAFLWFRLEPYKVNIGKRLTKSPKGYIADAGLLHFLLDIKNTEDLLLHPSAGLSFEGFVIQNLIAQRSIMDDGPRFYFWRTHAGGEADLVIEYKNYLIPIEIKHSARISKYDIRGILSFIDSYSNKTPFGLVIYRGETVRLTDRIIAVSLSNVF